MLQIGLRIFGSAFACSLLLACGGVLADNERREVATQVVGGDHFIAGGEITVGRPVDGDLVVTGGDVDVDAAVAGDVFASAASCAWAQTSAGRLLLPPGR
jgi:hypothetical protein